MIADAHGCIVVEPQKEGLQIYENRACVLANEPPFPSQMHQLGNYANLTAQPPCGRFGRLAVRADWQGAGAYGLPGDAGSPSRFVRAAFSLHNAAKGEGVPHFFHMLASAEMVRGNVLLADGTPDYTRYACCIDPAAGMYYVRTYDSLSVRAFPMRASAEGIASSFMRSEPLRSVSRFPSLRFAPFAPNCTPNAARQAPYRSD